MPFVANTPESLLGRSDSRDPGSTCRGITANGRPCRRPVARSPSGSLAPPARLVKADLGDENLYCWQHKEQASRSAQSSPGPRRNVEPILEQRTSLDTLADRLGLIDLPGKPKQKRPGHAKASNGDARPPQPGGPKPKPKKKKKSLSLCFCIRITVDDTADAAPPPRPRPKPRPLQQASSVAVPKHDKQQRITPSPGKNSHASKTSTTSDTARFKGLIPDALDAVTASTLMAELSRPFADAEEAGYIYMFWLTPLSKQDAAAPVAAARSLLAPPSPSRGGAHGRRASDVVSRFADSGETGGRGGTMLLKIGRAANVQRRMNQWQRQCGHDIEMLRYYPYMPGASDASATGQVPRMTPHCRRVERLIHLELAGLGLRASMGTCAACGRDHREWFQVEASREAVRSVDQVIRKWVEWDERA